MKLKALFATISIGCIVVTSCSKKMDFRNSETPITSAAESDLLSQFSHLKKFPESPIQIYSSPTQFQSLLSLVNQGKKSSTIVGDSMWANGTGQSLLAESIKQTVTEGSKDIVFPGSIFKGRIAINAVVYAISTRLGLYPSAGSS
ncbi:hypothetical protein [Chitinophaga sp. OAE865]|uniref:hypothetical protein n=1 Tax=Chitinophaga sp. OAE865 TaxID=2817898 RepID=UPI0033940A2F